jgi:hypothetical protein
MDCRALGGARGATAAYLGRKLAFNQLAHDQPLRKDGSMDSAAIIFLGGIGGVFVGMGLLYVAIRITTVLVERLVPASRAGKEGA